MMKRWTGADARLLVPSLEPKYLRTDGRKDNQEPPTFTLEIGTEILEFNNDVKKVKYTYVRTPPATQSLESQGWVCKGWVLDNFYEDPRAKISMDMCILQGTFLHCYNSLRWDEERTLSNQSMCYHVTTTFVFIIIKSDGDVKFAYILEAYTVIIFSCIREVSVPISLSLF